MLTSSDVATPRNEVVPMISPARSGRPQTSARSESRDSTVVDTSELTRRRLARARIAEGEERRRLQDAIVVDHIGVARSLARRYRNKGIDLDDLTQVAYLGLVKAVHGCDPEKCEDFRQYAVPTIVGELKRHFRDHGWSVRPTRRIQELHAAVRTARADLTQAEGREPTPEEVAAAVECTLDELSAADRAADLLRSNSLEAMVEAGNPVDFHTDSGLDAVDQAATLRPLLAQLPAREQDILRLRFVHERTQAEIGAELGLSQMHVSRLIARSLATLRSAMAGDQLAG